MFDVDRFMKQISAIAERQPQLRGRLLANAAWKIKQEADKPVNVRQRLRLLHLGNQLEEVAARLLIPPLDPVSGEMEQVFRDVGPDIATDFDETVAQHQAAAVDDFGQMHGELFQAGQLESIAKATGTVNASATNSVQNGITPPSAGGNSLLGNQALVEYGGNTKTGAQQEAQVVYWEGQSTEAMACTISCSRIGGGAGATFPAAQDGSGNSLAYRPYLRCKWGSSHAPPNEALVDCMNGCQFTVAAAYVYVSVGMDAPPAGGFNGSMMISAQLAFYAVGRQAPVYRTAYVDGVANGTHVDYLVPTFASKVQFYQQSPVAAGTMTALDPGLRKNYFQDFTNTNGNTFTEMGLSGDTSIIRLENKDLSVNNMFGRLIFTLSL